MNQVVAIIFFDIIVYWINFDENVGAIWYLQITWCKNHFKFGI
jgi:hypothetical protein